MKVKWTSRDSIWRARELGAKMRYKPQIAFLSTKMMQTMVFRCTTFLDRLKIAFNDFFGTDDRTWTLFWRLREPPSFEGVLSLTLAFSLMSTYTCTQQQPETCGKWWQSLLHPVDSLAHFHSIDGLPWVYHEVLTVWTHTSDILPIETTPITGFAKLQQRTLKGLHKIPFNFLPDSQQNWQ